MHTWSQRCKIILGLVGLCLASSLTSAAAEPAILGTQPPTGQKVALARAKDASSARQIVGAIKSAPSNGVNTRLLATSDFRSAIALGEGDEGLRLAIEGLLSRPLSQKGQQTTQSAVITRLVATLAAWQQSEYRAVLRNIYLTSYSSAQDLQQLDEAKQLTKLLHPLMQEWGVVEEGQFERSNAYKKLVRKQRLLADAKK